MLKINLRGKVSRITICVLILVTLTYSNFGRNVDAIPAPTLISPINGIIFTDNTPTLDWSASGSIIQSQIQVDTSTMFISPDIDHVLVGSSTLYTCPTLSDDTYYWRVRVMDDIEFTYSSWSTVWSFTIDTTGPSAPSLIYPIASTTDQTPTLDWSSSSLVRVSISGTHSPESPE